jgi:hypothetical protein
VFGVVFGSEITFIDEPHPAQNFEPSGFSLPHFTQNVLIVYVKPFLYITVWLMIIKISYSKNIRNKFFELFHLILIH